MSRWARRVDRVQPAVVEELRAHGCSVIHTHAVGGNAPDLVVGRRGHTVLVELKTPGREKREKDRLVKQAEARAAWRGASYIQATTGEAILAELGRLESLTPGVIPSPVLGSPA